VSDTKGRDRNKPCPCGSGVKAKRCHACDPAPPPPLPPKSLEQRAEDRRVAQGLIAMAAMCSAPAR
jgi:hypothetical protein